MPTCYQNINTFFKKIDLFPNSNFLRYNGEGEYTTASGGIVSAGVLIIFIILFASMGLKTAERKIIFTSEATVYQTNPSPLTMTTGVEGNMLFAFFVFGVDLNSVTNRLFDVKMYEETYDALMVPRSSTEIPLVQCTPAHIGFTDQIQAVYKQLLFPTKLCPQIGQTLDITGKITSSTYKQIKVTMKRCNNTIDPTCASDVTYNMMETMMGGRFMTAVPIINYLINPADEVYKSFYIEDRNRFFFSSTLGTSLIAEVREDTIENDVSIMPFEDIQTENVVRILDRLTSEPIVPLASDPLVTVIFRKALEATTYSRSFNKIDNYFSYVGGLVGTLIGFMFLMGKYNQTAFHVSIAHKLFKADEDKQIPSSSFNFGYYVLIVVKSILDCFNCKPKWEKTQTYIDSIEEMESQLDVTYILRKLTYLDSAMSKLLEEYEVKAICARQKPTLEKAKQVRKTHFSNEILRKGKKKQKQTSQQDDNFKNNQNLSEHKIVAPSVEEAKSADINEANINQLSQLELSFQEDDLRDIKDSVKKVKKDSQEGNKVSKKILGEIDKTFLSDLKGSQTQIINQTGSLVFESFDNELVQVRKKDSKGDQGEQPFTYNLE